MAQMIQQTVHIVMSKLVKDADVDTQVCDPDQIHMLLNTLPGVVEQILDAPGVVVEVITES